MRKNWPEILSMGNQDLIRALAFSKVDPLSKLWSRFSDCYINDNDTLSLQELLSILLNVNDREIIKRICMENKTLLKEVELSCRHLGHTSHDQISYIYQSPCALDNEELRITSVKKGGTVRESISRENICYYHVILNRTTIEKIGPKPLPTPMFGIIDHRESYHSHTLLLIRKDEDE